MCEEKQPRGRGARVWGAKSPKLEVGRQEAITPPCLLPHRRYQARKPRKGELGLFLFCPQPLPVSKLRAAASLTPPCPPPPTPKTPILGIVRAGICPDPGLPYVHLGCRGPLPSPLLGVDTQMDPPTCAHTLRRIPLHAGRAQALSSSLHQPALTVCPPPEPASAKLSPAPQVARGSSA